MKPNFLSLTSLFGGAIISVVSLTTTYESAQAGPSSYQRTCDAERFSNDYLLAHCSRGGGGIERASLKLRGIFNLDGTLVQNLLRNDIQVRSSCKNISLYKGVLRAECTKRNQSTVWTSIELEEITNRYGNLVYEIDSYINETARKIGYGHAYRKHVQEFNTDSTTPAQETFSRIVGDVIRKSEVRKNVSNGRRAYWKKINPSNYIPGNSQPKGTIVIVDPRNRDRGTMFVPSQGKAYYDGLR